MNPALRDAIKALLYGEHALRTTTEGRTLIHDNGNYQGRHRAEIAWGAIGVVWGCGWTETAIGMTMKKLECGRDTAIEEMRRLGAVFDE
jgi:hypothetical protein